MSEKNWWEETPEEFANSFTEEIEVHHGNPLLSNLSPRERANNAIHNSATYQFFNAMSNEQLLDWLNNVATTAGHQDEIEIIRNWVLDERGYEVVDNPGQGFFNRYKLVPIESKE